MMGYGELVWLSAVGAVEMLALIGLYARASWYRSLAGWVLMSSFATKFVIFVLILVAAKTGPLGPVPWEIAFAIFDCVQAGWLVLLVRSRYEERRHGRPGGPPTSAGTPLSP